MVRFLLVAVLSLPALACSDSSGGGATVVDGSSVTSDSGAAAADSGGKAAAPLYITSELALIDKPTRAEWTPIDGRIEIAENGMTPVSTVNTTVNGVQINSGTDDALLIDKLAGSLHPTGVSALPGGNLTIVVTGGGHSATLVTPCPADVVITSPVEGAVVTPGSSLAVSWTGSPGTKASSLIHPFVALYPYNSADNKYTFWNLVPPADSAKELTSTDTGAMLTVPSATVSGYDDLILVLDAIGTYVTTDQGEGYCWLSRRVHLVKG